MNKKELMSKAWEYRKDVAEQLGVKVSEVSMSECLKIVWFQAKNTKLIYDGKVIAKVVFFGVNECMIRLLVNTILPQVKLYAYTDFQKVKIETVRLYKKLSYTYNEDVKMSRLDVYNNLTLISTHEKYRETLNKVVMLDIILIALYELKAMLLIADYTNNRIVYAHSILNIHDISDIFYNFWVKCFRNTERKALQIKVGLLNRKINKEIKQNECLTSYAEYLFYLKNKVKQDYRLKEA